MVLDGVSTGLLRPRLYIKDLSIGELVNDGTDSLNVDRHINIVDILSEFVCSSFVFAILSRDVKLVNRVAIAASLVVGRSTHNDHRSLQLHCRVIPKTQGFLMDLALASHSPKQLDKSFDCDTGTMHFLSIGDVESLIAAFDLTGKKRKICLLLP